MANYGTRYVKKKTPWGTFICLLVLFLALGYLISGLYVCPTDLKGDYNAQFLWAATHPFQIANEKTPAWIGIGFMGWFFFVSYYMVHYRDFQVWMDEFYAGARPADTEKLLGVIRSRNISAVIMLQSIAQAKAIFPNDKWEILMDNLATAVYLGSGPFAKSTHEFISEMLQSATADKRDDRLSYGMNQSSDLSYSKAEMKLMTPGQVKRMPPTECIVFFESRPPIYDTKAIPFDKPEYGFVAADWLKDRYKAALSLGDYEHPVETIYDPENFKYITLSREKSLEIVSDQNEIKRLKELAKNDPSIYELTVDERDLLYLSFGDEKKTMDEIEKIYRQTVQSADEDLERIKGLALLHNVDIAALGLGEEKQTDKTEWKADSFTDFVALYWDELQQAEQEILLMAMDDGLLDDQLIRVGMSDLTEMDNIRRAFILKNKE